MFSFSDLTFAKKKKERKKETRISQFSAYELTMFTEYKAWATFGGRKLEVT